MNKTHLSHYECIAFEFHLHILYYFFMQRIFISSDQLTDNAIKLDQKTAHHLFDVCRLTIRDTLEVVVNSDRLLKVQIVAIDSPKIQIRIDDQWAISPKRDIPITLIQSLPKRDKLTEICRMCTEIGVSEFFPVISEFCDVKTLSDNKFKRVNHAVESAAQQSKQGHLPILHQPQLLSDCLAQITFPPDALLLLSDEASTDLVGSLIHTPPSHIYLAIGPEGGYGANDHDLFASAGFISFSLGNFILRTEHAGFSAINQLDGCLWAQLFS